MVNCDKKIMKESRLCAGDDCCKVISASNTSGFCLSCGARQRMKALNADPEFAKAHSERMKARHADQTKDMRQKHLRGLTPEQRANYDAFRKSGFSKAEALAMIREV